eukprot:sb/3461716/
MVAKIEEDFEDKRRSALKDLERSLLAERQAQYKKAIESSNTEWTTIINRNKLVSQTIVSPNHYYKYPFKKRQLGSELLTMKSCPGSSPQKSLLADKVDSILDEMVENNQIIGDIGTWCDPHTYTRGLQVYLHVREGVMFYKSRWRAPRSKTSTIYVVIKQRDHTKQVKQLEMKVQSASLHSYTLETIVLTIQKGEMMREIAVNCRSRGTVANRLAGAKHIQRALLDVHTLPLGGRLSRHKLTAVHGPIDACKLFERAVHLFEPAGFICVGIALGGYVAKDIIYQRGRVEIDKIVVSEQEPTEIHYFGHVTGYQPIRRQYFLGFGRFSSSFQMDKIAAEEERSSTTSIYKSALASALSPEKQRAVLEQFSTQLESIEIQLRAAEATRASTLEHKIAERKRKREMQLREEFEAEKLVNQGPVNRGPTVRAVTDRNNKTNQNSLFRSCDWLSANQGPVFPDHDSVGSCYRTEKKIREEGTMTDEQAQTALDHLRETQSRETESLEKRLITREQETLSKMDKIAAEEERSSTTSIYKTALASALSPEKQRAVLEQFSTQLESIEIQLRAAEATRASTLEHKIAERKRKREMQLREEFEAEKLGPATTTIPPSSSGIMGPVSAGGAAVSAELSARHSESLAVLEREGQDEMDRLEEQLGAGESGEIEKLNVEQATAQGKQVRELKNRQEAELRARTGEMSPEEAGRIAAEHAQSMKELKDRLETDKMRQESKLREQLAKKREARTRELRAQQEAKRAREIREQEDEMAELRGSAIKEAETSAIRQGIADGYSAEEAVRGVLLERQTREQSELLASLETEQDRRLRDTLDGIERRRDEEKRLLKEKHNREIAAAEGDDDKLAELRNAHAQEMGDFDRETEAQLSAAKRDLELDFESRKGDALLDQRKRHLEELAQQANVSSLPLCLSLSLSFSLCLSLCLSLSLSLCLSLCLSLPHYPYCRS